MKTIRIGTRGSDLALWQANYVSDLLRKQYDHVNVEIRIYKTQGDKQIDKPLPKIGGKGLFTAELEQALRQEEIDCAVHSLKDLPTDKVDGIFMGAIPERGDHTDALLSRDNKTLDQLPMGASVGTSSLRRRAQLLHHRPDLNIVDIRGNVPTRIEKLLADDSQYDAIVLASAGLQRLNLDQHITEVLTAPLMINAPAQGALGIQCREEPDSMSFFAPLMHLQTWLAVTAERSFLKTLGGGCSLPVSAYAYIEKSVLHLVSRVSSVDGTKQIDIENKIGLIRESNIIDSANRLGVQAAQEAIDQGADVLLQQSHV